MSWMVPSLSEGKLWYMARLATPRRTWYYIVNEVEDYKRLC